MAAEFDETDFIDRDFLAAKSPPAAGTVHGTGPRPPSREELETKVGETHQRLQELKRQQDELERERTSLEEARRRRTEYHLGREEMLENLTRGIGLLEEAEFDARRDAEQMAKTLGQLRDSLIKLQNLNDQLWTQENYSVELTRALTTIENGRMEWNAALLKWSVLSGNAEPVVDTRAGRPQGAPAWQTMTFFQLCKVGLGLTWPLALVLAGAVTALVVILTNR